MAEQIRVKKKSRLCQHRETILREPFLAASQAKTPANVQSANRQIQGRRHDAGDKCSASLQTCATGLTFSVGVDVVEGKVVE